MGFNYEQYEEVLEGTNDVSENEEVMNFMGDEYDYADGEGEVEVAPLIVKKEIFTKKNIAMGLGLVAIIGAVIYFNKK